MSVPFAGCGRGLRKRAGAALLVVLLLLSAPGSPLRAQERPPDAADLVNAVLGGLLGFKDVTGPELQQEVAEVGGVPFRAPVALDYLTPAELSRYLEGVLDEEYPPARALADQRTLVAFDLLPAEVDLRAVRSRVLEENIAGFYDERPGRKRLYAVSHDRTLTPANQLVLSHELRHAMQDQYADVHRVVAAEVGDYDDRRLAFLCLLEGDATMVMERFLMRRLADGPLLSDESADLSWPVPPVPGVPPVVRDQLVLPYVIGRDFARALHQRGGWEAIRAAWTSPPASTEQVLHPEKFFAKEAPREVRVTWAPGKGRLLMEGVLGELLTRTLLAAERPDSSSSSVLPLGGSEVEKAAAGWGGDAFRVWDVKGRTLLVWRTEWDHGEEAREFRDALARRLERTHGPRRNLQGASLFSRPGWLMAVQAAGDAVTVVSSDDPALLPAALEGAGGGA